MATVAQLKQQPTKIEACKSMLAKKTYLVAFPCGHLVPGVQPPVEWLGLIGAQHPGKTPVGTILKNCAQNWGDIPSLPLQIPLLTNVHGFPVDLPVM